MKALGIAALVLMALLWFLRSYSRQYDTIRDAETSVYNNSAGTTTPIDKVIKTHYRYLSEDIQGYCVNLALFGTGVFLIVASVISKAREKQNAEMTIV